MPAQNTFHNRGLEQALTNLKKEQSKENLLKASRALLDTKVLAPAKWDKEPEVMENGDTRFSPDTKISLMVVTNSKGQRMFPFFTSMDEVRKLYKEGPANCLILTLKQYLPFIEAAGEDIVGAVINPAGLNVVFPSEFLKGINKADTKPLNQHTIRKGDKVHVKNLDKNYQDLEAALISAGFHNKPIRAIYIKERMDDPGNPEKTHWFVVVDSDELDTTLFQNIGAACKDVMHGKEMEFMFTDQKLGADIARTSKPIYSRLMQA